MRALTGLSVAASVAMSFGGVGCGSGPLPKLEGAVAISAGGQHACAALGDGTAVCWGANGSRELGSNSDSMTEARPIRVGDLSNVKLVAAGGVNSCALLGDGTVSCWGDNSLGELGRGDSIDSSVATPTQVVGLSGVAAIIVAGPGFDDVTSNIQDHFACALLATGTVDCWGESTKDEVGAGVDFGRIVFPSAMPVAGVASAVALGLAASGACVVVADGGVSCWGNGFAGVLGEAVTEDSSPSPVAIQGLSGPAAEVTGGVYHRCALLRDGTASCWGSDVGSSGLLGAGSAVAGTIARTPVAVTDLSGVVQIAAGPFHTCAVRTDGTVWCWGQNDKGQVGGGPTKCALVPMQVKGVTGAKAISVGQAFSCALLGTGEVQCWGDDAAGELGNGTTAATPPAAPVVVTAPAAG
jgi:alpha-tubulin suppressor-like RCC1 family protein